MSTPGGVEFGKVRAPLDQGAVDSYLSQHIPGFKTPSDIKQFSFGQSYVALHHLPLTGQRTDGREDQLIEIQPILLRMPAENDTSYERNRLGNWFLRPLMLLRESFE